MTVIIEYVLQNPAYMVFACLVADQDLLFVTYQVPCISICRAEQRAKALERLGMPQGVYQDIQDRGGNAPSVTGGTLEKAGKRTAVKPDLAGDEEEMDAKSLVDTWKKVVDTNNRELRLPWVYSFQAMWEGPQVGFRDG